MTEYKKMSQEKYETMLAEMRRDGIFTSTKEPSVELTLSELTKILTVIILQHQNSVAGIFLHIIFKV